MSFFNQWLKKEVGVDTEQKIAELTLIKDKLLAILQTQQTATFAVEPEGRIFFWSRGAEKLTGFPFAYALGKIYSQVVKLNLPPTQPITAPLAESLTQKRTVKIESTLNKNGKAVPLSLTFTPLFDDQQKILGAVVEMVDISEEKRVEQMKIDFVSIVSHELRTPITNIKSYLDVVLREAGYLTPEHRQFLERAFWSNERQLETIEALLNISKIEQGTVKVDLAPIRLEDVISGVVAEWEEQAHLKGLELKFIYPHLTLPQVLADRDRMREVLTNLVSNGIKYTQKGSVTITITQKGKELVVSVADTGPGIPEELKPKLFQRFSRGERSLTEETPGTGLGLYIAKSFTELMGGQIWFESKIGRGSTFSFSLPIAT